jgi:cyclohexadienyl dehydratase
VTRVWAPANERRLAAAPDQPFEVVDKAYWLPRDDAFKAFVDQWLQGMIDSGRFRAISDGWFNAGVNR